MSADFYGRPGILRLLLALSGPGAFLSFSSPAEAQSQGSEPMKVVVGDFAGAKGTSARSWVSEGAAADGRFEVLPDSLGLKYGASESAIAEAALGAEADVVVLGKGTFSKGWSGELKIYDGKDGHLIETVSVKGPTWQEYEAAMRGGESYFGVMAGAVGFPPPAPVPEEEVSLEEEPEEPVATEPKVVVGPSPLDFTLGARIYGRAFRYTDTQNQLAPDDGWDPLVDYSLDAAPLLYVGAHWYPGAHAGSGVLSHFGLTGGFERGFATKVNYAETGQTFTQNHQLWFVGARARIPVEPFTFGIGANYGGHLFSLKDPEDGVVPFPSVNYQFLEIAADGEVVLGKVILGAQFGYLLVMDVGQVGSEEWFPNAKAKGIHLAGHVGWRFSKVVDALVTLDSRAYGLDFNPVPVGDEGDPVAGGATDRYLSGAFALRFTLPGKGAAAAAEAEASGQADGDSGDGDSKSGGTDSFDSFD